MSTNLEREIRKCRILSCMQVRAVGSKYSDHPRRALWDICGKPSIQWVLEAVKGCKYIDKIVVTTEDKEIKNVVEKLGITVVDRPLYTALDYPRNYGSGTFRLDNPRSLRSKVPDIFLSTLEYMLYWLREKEGYVPDIILQVGANVPMVTTDMVNRIVEAFFKDKEADLVFSFTPGPTHIYIENTKTGRPFPLLYAPFYDRQIYPDIWVQSAFSLCGLAECSKSQGAKIAPVYFTEEEGLDMHNKEDLFRARCYMKSRLIKAGKEVKWEIGQDDVMGKKEKGEKE